MKRPFPLTLIITVSVCAIVLVAQAANNRELARLAAAQVDPEPAFSIQPERVAPEDPEKRREQATAGVEKVAIEIAQLVNSGMGKRDAFTKKMPELLRAVEELSAEDLIALAGEMPESEVKSTLVLLAAETRPMEVYQDADLMEGVSREAVLSVMGRKDSLGTLDLLPPLKSLADKSFSPMPSGDIHVRRHLAVRALGEDVDAGLRALLEVRKNDNTHREGTMDPMGVMVGFGVPPLPEQAVPGMIEAMSNPEFAYIRNDLIKMTLDHYLKSYGVASAAQQAESMPLSAEDLGRYLDSITGHAGSVMQTSDGGALLDWIVSSLPEENQQARLPEQFLAWANSHAVAAAEWLGAQEPSPLRDRTITRFVDRSPTLDRESAAQWALEIQDEGSRSNSLRRVVERWRNEDAAAADAWLGENGFEL